MAKLEYNAIGLMSGTSLDGLDICYVNFIYEDGRWSYRMLDADSVEYPESLHEALATAQDMSALEYARLHSDYGLFIGRQVRGFIEKRGIKPDFVASHGQTIFHQPSIRFTGQIGSGAGIAAETGVDTICDFRTTDVALGGQGAPLVPVGDRELFGEYGYCLNLGGFSNISFTKGEKRIAYDISPVNYVLNEYARRAGKEYDEDGKMARSGRICEELLQRLDALDFYHKGGPKSLGREWVEKEVFPLMESFSLSTEDSLATFVEHIARQIAANVEGGKVLVTGGGALNKYLLERMQANKPDAEYVVPDRLTVNFKEALIFAFLGALYMAGQANCLASVTGASRDNIGGCLYRGSIR
ncbi:MAG: anhydro-N-acetylmuramic acid kinase [Bacteroidales bacterium]|nr:anhydro-N-acetylmuramic acid kinase [Candidatus Cacconaster merdequi]